MDPDWTGARRNPRSYGDPSRGGCTPADTHLRRVVQPCYSPRGASGKQASAVWPPHDDIRRKRTEAAARGDGSNPVLEYLVA
jgi:hypothetical protein